MSSEISLSEVTSRHLYQQLNGWNQASRGLKPNMVIAEWCIVGLGISKQCCSVSKSCPTLQPHELQHARLPCPSLSPRVCSNSCLLSWWCHPTISSSITAFSCPQCFPASGSFPVSRLFASGGQSIRASASASVLPMNIQGWFPLG